MRKGPVRPACGKGVGRELCVGVRIAGRRDLSGCRSPQRPPLPPERCGVASGAEECGGSRCSVLE